MSAANSVRSSRGGPVAIFPVARADASVAHLASHQFKPVPTEPILLLVGSCLVSLGLEVSVRLDASHIARLEQFFSAVASETYPEVPTELHTSISNLMLDKLLPAWGLAPNAKVLDVGCGQGLALRRFHEAGYQPEGITLNPVDVEACRRQGFNVQAMDQNFLDYPDEAFQLVWCRHCLEHSPLPLFTLRQFHRVLKPGGFLYVEVPAPDTISRHQENPNHYSVLGLTMWVQLLQRAGFTILEQLSIDVPLAIGPDMYWAFHCRR